MFRSGTGTSVVLQTETTLYNWVRPITSVDCGLQPGKIKADGFVFAGVENWKSLCKTPYVMDPIVQGIYATTAGVSGQDLKLDKKPPT